MLIAHDALNTYKEKNTSDGKRLVSEAWKQAKKGAVTLPPLIMAELNV